MSEVKKSTDGTYMYEHWGLKIKKCMAVLCNEERRKTCVWHKRWLVEPSGIHSYFGESSRKCDYYKSIE